MENDRATRERLCKLAHRVFAIQRRQVHCEVRSMRQRQEGIGLWVLLSCARTPRISANLCHISHCCVHLLVASGE
jgi:hypothetical protein